MWTRCGESQSPRDRTALFQYYPSVLPKKGHAADKVQRVVTPEVLLAGQRSGKGGASLSASKTKSYIHPGDPAALEVTAFCRLDHSSGPSRAQ